jgi:hypothetical protein
MEQKGGEKGDARKLGAEERKREEKREEAR